MKLKMLASAFAIAASIGPVAFAQSSGNFSATGSGEACVINSATGSLSGGVPVSKFTTYISSSNGSGVTLDIRPSLVTGLFTDTKISTTVPSATADVGIQVCVSVDGSPLDSTSPVKPAPCATYDQRFQQISSNLFSQLTACTTTTACDLTATPPVACGSGYTCSSTTGPGVCLNNLCDFELILSTLSAHSFDFVVPVGNGKPHTITTSWSTIGTPNSSAISCVGPGIVTVTQVKVFNNSGSLSF